MSLKNICVIGSINMDLTAFVDRFPKPGETITGNNFKNSPGGKGANQAVAAARLGGEVGMFGKIGNDFYGQEYLKVFKKNNVNPCGVGTSSDVSTGIAVIEVDKSGENHIVVIPGANGEVDTNFIDSKFELLKKYDIFLFQLEIPIETIAYAIEKLSQLNKIIILDPAPARKLPDSMYSMIDFITLNETEMSILSGVNIKCEDDFLKAGKMLISKGVRTVIAKAGSKGSYKIDESGMEHFPGFSVNAVDTTAAGDTFNGGFAYKLSTGSDVSECIRFGNAAAALSTTALGAQDAIPGIVEVKSLMKEQYKNM